MVCLLVLVILTCTYLLISPYVLKTDGNNSPGSGPNGSPRGPSPGGGPTPPSNDRGVSEPPIKRRKGKRSWDEMLRQEKDNHIRKQEKQAENRKQAEKRKQDNKIRKQEKQARGQAWRLEKEERAWRLGAVRQSQMEQSQIGIQLSQVPQIQSQQGQSTQLGYPPYYEPYQHTHTQTELPWNPYYWDHACQQVSKAGQ